MYLLKIKKKIQKIKKVLLKFLKKIYNTLYNLIYVDYALKAIKIELTLQKLL